MGIMGWIIEQWKLWRLRRMLKRGEHLRFYGVMMPGMFKSQEEMAEAFQNMAQVMQDIVAELAVNMEECASAFLRLGEALHNSFTEAEHKEAEEAGVPVIDYWARR